MHTALLPTVSTSKASIVIILTIAICSCTSNPEKPGGTMNPEVQEPVMSLESHEIGGIQQWILLKGQNRHLPVLLWLHGGPGAAQMPLAHINHQLEEHFIVVHWDQRGAGKSNPRNFNPSTMSFERYLEDARELTEYLRERFDQDKIFLVGHSWGTQMGLHLAHRHPEYYAAFISVGQVVQTQMAHVATRSWLETEIRRQGELSSQARRKSRKDLAKLEALGPAPYPIHKDYVTLAQLVDRYNGGMDWSFGKMAKEALKSPFYGLGAYSRWLSGAQRGSGPMWLEYYQFDNFRDVGRIEVPIYFIAGDKDWNTPLELTRQYHEFLEAPAGKELVIIKGTAHSPFLAKPEEFAEILETIRNRHLPDS